jgi:hypothetical protein
MQIAQSGSGLETHALPCKGRKRVSALLSRAEASRRSQSDGRSVVGYSEADALTQRAEDLKCTLRLARARIIDMATLWAPHGEVAGMGGLQLSLYGVTCAYD